MSSARNDYDSYVNGEWKATAVIPDDQVRWGSFQMLCEENRGRLKLLCEKDTGIVGKVYATAIKVPTEISPTATGLMATVAASVTDVASYFSTVGNLFTSGIQVLVAIGKSSDDKDPNTYVPHIQQTGLGLPDMSDFTNSPDLHGPYKQFMTGLCKLYGYEIDADALFEFESRKAALHLTRVQRRDSDATYNKMNWQDVRATCPAFFDALALQSTPMTYAIVQNPTLLQGLQSLVEATPAATLRDHLLFSVAAYLAPFQTAEICAAKFAFYGTLLQGQKVQKDMPTRAQEMVDRYIGDELAKLYVAEHYPDANKKSCEAMVNSLVVALHATLQDSSWMTDHTKKAALVKLDKFTFKIGYPNKWHNVDGLWEDITTTQQDMTTLVLDWGVWDWASQECPLFYTKVDRELWHMGAHEVNAYYNANMNEIVFPAGILQKPFFGFDTLEENLGAIGMIIGHEMTHGFDDEGRKYNADGELCEWWAPEDCAEFDRRAKPVEEHYSSLTYFGKPVNGKLTLGENIADIGGIKLALRALQQAHTDVNGVVNVSHEVYDRFFRSSAVMGQQVCREAFAHRMLVVDPHSPAPLRCNATLAHVPEFYATYGVQEGDGMYLAPEKRMTIW